MFSAALATLYGGFWGADLTRAVPHAVGAGQGAVPRPVVRADYRLAVWAVGRNARTLLTQPLHLFDAEPCHPADSRWPSTPHSGGYIPPIGLSGRLG